MTDASPVKRKRGRPAGQQKSTGPQPGSTNAHLAMLPVGGVLYFECDSPVNATTRARRVNDTDRRRPECMRGMKFETSTATGVLRPGTAKVLLRVQRVK